MEFIWRENIKAGISRSIAPFALSSEQSSYYIRVKTCVKTLSLAEFCDSCPCNPLVFSIESRIFTKRSFPAHQRANKSIISTHFFRGCTFFAVFWKVSWVDCGTFKGRAHKKNEMRHLYINEAINYMSGRQPRRQYSVDSPTCLLTIPRFDQRHDSWHCYYDPPTFTCICVFRLHYFSTTL